VGALVIRAASCSAAFLVCVLIAASPAQAAGWTAATTVGGGAADVPVLAADGVGDTAIAYQLGEAGVTGAVRPAGGVFTGAGSLSTVGDRPAIAANLAGAVIAGWATDDAVAFAAGSATAGFTGGGAVPDPGVAPVDVSVGIDDAGNQWLAWLDDAGAVRAFRRDTGATVGVSPQPPVETPRMAVAPGGAVTIVWVRRTQTTPGNDVRVVTRVERATIGSTQIDVLDTAIQITEGDTDIATGSEVREPQIVAGSGAPTIAWVNQDISDAGTPADDEDDIATDSVRVSLDGGGAQTLGSSTNGITTFDLDEARDGAAVVAWDENAGETAVIRAAFRPAGGAFGAAETVASGGLVDGVSEARAAVRAGGEPLVLWLRGVLSGEVPVNRLDAAVRGSGGWQVATPPGDLDVEAPTLAADGEGNVVAAWTAPVGGDRQARVAAYDGAGPRLTGLTIPQAGRPGETLGFSAAATDTWSGIAGVNWSFGDGASAGGADVQHAYANVGDYAASVTVTDGEGNQSGDGSVLRISGDGTPPPPPPAPPKDTTAPVVSGLVVSPRCIAPTDVRSLIATFSVSESAQMLYSIRRRKDSLIRRRCPGATTRKTPGISEEAGSRQEQVVPGPNSATISGAKLRRGSVHKRAARGRNRVRFSQLLTGLRPGTYQLIVRATDAAGNRSVDQIVKFWVLAPPREG
jgi:hypothetical protein